jgi:DNA-binding XRE family transcriptional regulator
MYGEVTAYMTRSDRGTSRLRELRRIAGLSQDELARKAGVSRSTIQAVEEGALPRLRTARKLAAALGVPVSAIVEDFDG